MANMTPRDIFQHLPDLRPLLKHYALRLSLVSTAAVLIPFSIACVRNYQSWIALGAGGLPYNPVGWTGAWIIKMFSKRDVLSTECYDDPEVIARSGDYARESFLKGGLERREGERPKIAGFVVPHRQVPPGNPLEIRKLQSEQFYAIAEANPFVIQIRTSKLERHGPAFWLVPEIPVPEWAKRTRGEIAHMHLDSDGSGHVMLSLADAKEVIEKGWGERHGFSGVILPSSYMIIYAPRNEEEVRIVGQIFKAGIRCVSNGREVL